MDLGLAGAGCLVTGAGEGMGRATALSLASEGARLVICARSSNSLDAVADECRTRGAAEVVAIPGDLFDADAAARVVDAAIEALGGVDVMVNTVGLCEPEPGQILAEDDEYWERAFHGVLLVNVRLCRLVIPHMRERGGGSIVNVSATSINHHMPLLAHYSAQKAALAHFTRTAAKEFGRDGIRLNAVLPGMIESEYVRARHVRRMAETGMSEQELFDESNARYGEATWSNRYGQPDEVAATITFLVSQQAGYVNGALVPVDGGSG